jgi:hypothetical protein
VKWTEADDPIQILGTTESGAFVGYYRNKQEKPVAFSGAYKEWLLVEETPKRPRLLAYIQGGGSVCMVEECESDKMPGVWRRAPWLDEPVDGGDETISIDSI